MNSASPLISVVLPTYNRAALLPRAIASVLAQSFEDFELIVVDDASEEDIPGVIRRTKDDRVRYIRRDVRGGAAAARNSGIGAARGTWIAFQDSDDEWLLGKLESQVADLEPLDGGSMSVCGVLRLIDDPARGASVLAYPRATSDWDHGLDRRAVLVSAVAYTQSWLVPRQAVLDAGGFDAQLCIWDDWDLLIRLSARLAIRIRREPLVVSARIADSLSVDPSRFARDLPVVLAKYEEELRRRPKDHAALQYLLGLWLYRARRLPEARAALLHSIRLRMAQPAAWKLLARALLKQALA